MKKNEVKKIEAGIFAIVMIILFLSSFAVAQTDSLIWENIPGGTPLNTWVENSEDEWDPYNNSGIGQYNFSGDVWGYLLNGTVMGHRWFQTFEVSAESAATGIMSVMSWNNSNDSSNFYAMVYYLSGELSTTPEAYMIRMVAGTPYYYNGSGWDTNMSNATDFTADEIDYYSGFVRVKALWNFYDEYNGDFTAYFKIWDPAGDEPDDWMIKNEFTALGADGLIDDYYAGVGFDNTFTGASDCYLRRLAMWNLSYDKYDDSVAYIGVPQYDALTLINDIDNMSEGEDIWNYTTAFVDMINHWDLTSYWVEDDGYDNVYVFSVMTTDWEDVFDLYWGEEWWEVWEDAVFPNNVLYVYAYNPTDITPGDEEELVWDDFCRIRFDFNNDGYGADDYTFEIDGTSTLFGYRGWTQVIPDSPEEWYGEGYLDIVDDDSWGTMFHDKDYPAYIFYLNWDLISNGTDAGELVNISISFYDDNETAPDNNYTLWQDWNETDGAHSLDPSDNQTWQSENTTTLWGLMEIEGAALDFEDPAAPYETPEVTLDLDAIMTMVDLVVQIAIFVLLLSFLFGLIGKIKI